MDNDDDSEDYSYGKHSDSYGGLNLNGPSFSNSSDVSNIRNTIDKSRAEQTSSNQGVAKEDEEDNKDDKDDNKKESELEDKDKLDNKDNKDNKDEKDNSKDDKKDDKSDSKDGKKESGGLLSKKDDINPLKKLKGKFIILKTKLILMGIVVAFGMVSMLFIVGFFVGIVTALGGEINEEEGNEAVPQSEMIDNGGEYTDTDTGDNGEETENNEETDTSEETENSEETETPSIIKPGQDRNHNDPGGMTKEEK